MTEPPVRINGSAFCTVNSVARALRLNVASKFSSVILPSISGSPRAELATRMSKPTSVSRTVANNLSRSAVSVTSPATVFRPSPIVLCLIQRASAAAHDEDVGAFVDEPVCGRQPDTAAAAGDHGDLASQSCHQLILQFRVVCWTC